MSNAVLYAGLVGKYIRMERPATDEEQAAGGPPTVGMECLVARVHDEGPGHVVVVGDEGMACTVDMEHFDEWTFTVWPDEATARKFR